MKLWLPLACLGLACSRPAGRGDSPAPMPSSSAAALVAPPSSSAPPPPEVPEEMVLVPAKEFASCRQRYDPPDKCEPAKHVPAFLLDRTEVTVAEFAKCVEAGACTKKKLAVDHFCNWPKRDERGQHPINCVTAEGADAYCAWKQKRLPSGLEWERAARDDGRKYVWTGEEPAKLDDAFRLACWAGYGTCPVGTASAFEPLGLEDLAGNVGEWTSDDARQDSTFRSAVQGRNPSWHWRVAYGTSWMDPDPHDLSLLALAWAEPHALEQGPGPSVGLRCARSLP